MKNSVRTVAFTVVLLLLSIPSWAHVVVTPSKAGVGSWVTFNVSVPNEKEVPNTQLKLVLPAGLDSVSPTVKPGWKITVEKDAGGSPTAIVWSGGNLPSEFRDDFTFGAQVPAKPVDLAWKAYQTYQGGEVVGWDVDPTDPSAKDPEALEKTGKGPFSVTHVLDDLKGPAMMMAPNKVAEHAPESPTASIALLVSVVALIVGVVALVRRRKVN
jgi:uncharacterized protein YcnI